MAQEIDDGNFWLPSEFLNDDDFKPAKPNCGLLSRNRSFCGFGSNSDLSSPVESSTETESDEEDYLNELTRKLAQSTLDDGFWKAEANFGLENRYSKSTRVMAGSPQSTLCGCKQISSRGSPNCLSPPLTAAPHDSAWNLLHAAAGEVARLKMAEEASLKYYNPNRNHIAPQPLRKATTNPNPQFHHFQAAQVQQLKQQQMMKQKQQQYLQLLQQQTRGRNGGGNMKPVAMPLSAWPTLQQSQPLIGSGMRAVFLPNPANKRESSGTGVFLPRQIGAPTETRKKRGCSTVLQPVESQTRSTGGRNPRDYDGRKSVSMAEQRVEKDLRLPQEWTY